MRHTLCSQRSPAVDRSADFLLLVGMRLRVERKRQGRTLQQLAADLGFHHSSLSRIERGLARDVSLLTILTMATALGVPLWELCVPTMGRQGLEMLAHAAPDRTEEDARVLAITPTHGPSARASLLPAAQEPDALRA